jgi:hypothetical protein
MREGTDFTKRRRSPVTAAIVAGISTLIVNFAVDRLGLISETSYVPGLIIRSALVVLLMWISFRTLDTIKRAD